jgi:class 3 adenylate cyclase
MRNFRKMRPRPIHDQRYSGLVTLADEMTKLVPDFRSDWSARNTSQPDNPTSLQTDIPRSATNSIWV